MTFREKLQKEHPDKVSPFAVGGCCECPYNYGYESPDDRPCRRVNEFTCRDCWNRTIPGTEEPKTFDFKLETLNALIERAATKKDISLSIFIREGDTHISIYPCPDPSEKKGNPVAEAYKLLVGRPHSAEAYETAIEKLGEALE